MHHVGASAGLFLNQLAFLSVQGTMVISLALLLRQVYGRRQEQVRAGGAIPMQEANFR